MAEIKTKPVKLNLMEAFRIFGTNFIHAFNASTAMCPASVVTKLLRPVCFDISE